jgi:hypothetical protein
MLFLMRPRQTWMPYALPRDPQQQNLYNQQLQKGYDNTRRVEPSAPSASEPRDPIAALNDLAEMHANGALSDEEFTAAKARLISELDSGR